MTERSSNQMESSLTGRLRARTTASRFVIAPESPQIVPSDRRFRGNLNRYGSSRTVMRASLEDVPASSYDVKLKIEGFNAAVAGHNHTPVPADFWGKVALDSARLDEDSYTKSEEECTIVVDASGSGSCDFYYQADEVSGQASFSASTMIDGIPEDATSTLDVRIDNLLDIRALTSLIGGTLRGEDADHVDDVAFRSTITTAARTALMMAVFTNATTSPQRPQGLAMLMNDISLPWGGLFDVTGDWVQPHESHRRGRGVDVNSRGTAVPNLQLPPAARPLVLLSRPTMEEACVQAGGYVIVEDTFHCEF